MYRILVCDDERDIVSALRIYLEAEGHEVVAAYTGRRPWRLWSRRRSISSSSTS